jgi:RNA recognition motif-containing protein
MLPFHLRTNYRKTHIERTKLQLYIANLDYNCTSEELYYHVSDFGEVEYVDLPLRRHGKGNKGYAWVKFKHLADAELFTKYCEEN